MTEGFERQRELEELKSRLAKLESERSGRKGKAKRLWTVLGIAAVLSAVLVTSSALSDPSSPLACLTSSELYCFGANTPAKASEINHNFAQLTSWLEQKVGTATEAHVSASSASVAGPLDVEGNTSYGSAVRQMINLYDTSYGIGVQSNTQYYRTNENFAWYKGGTHHDSAYNAGGGTSLMRLDSGSLELFVPIKGSRACPSGYHSGSGFCYTDVRRSANSTSGGGLSPHEAQQDCVDEGADLCSVGQYYMTDGGGGTCAGSGRCWTNGYCSGTQGMYITVWTGWNCVGWSTKYAYRCCRSK